MRVAGSFEEYYIFTFIDSLWSNNSFGSQFIPLIIVTNTSFDAPAAAPDGTLKPRRILL
jgi:hypothetical protein